MNNGSRYGTILEVKAKVLKARVKVLKLEADILKDKAENSNGLKKELLLARSKVAYLKAEQLLSIADKQKNE